MKCKVFIITFPLRAKGRLQRQQSISYLFMINDFTGPTRPLLQYLQKHAV